MTFALFVTQALNGLQLGILLFLLAAGLTLVFGIMNFVNLAHGSLYMMGAYFAAAVTMPPTRSCSSASSRAGDDAARHRGIERWRCCGSITAIISTRCSRRSA
jgi:ABC-type branched-subunit amino acid transport system permease subunit